MRAYNAQTGGISSKFIRIITVKYVVEENFPESKEEILLID